MKRIVLLFTILLLLPAGHVSGCFGPKLYIGVDDTPRQQLFYALVSLYIKEKTGTESEQVAAPAEDRLQLIAADRADLVIASAGDPGGHPVLFQVPGLPRVVSGPRPVKELQFTLVAPALEKLSGLLTPARFEPLAKAVAEGSPPAATARSFLMGQGWI